MKLLRPRFGALELCKGLRLSREARAARADNLDPIAFFLTLSAREELHADALRCLPGLLPRRVAVWWGSLCVWEMGRRHPSLLVDRSLEAVLRWVQRPTRQNRLAAEAPAKAGDFDSAAGCLAQAVFWSAGSFTQPPLTPIPVPKILTADLVGAAVIFAAVEYEPLYYRDHHRHFLQLGMDVAGGRNLWPRPRSTVATASSESAALSTMAI